MKMRFEIYKDGLGEFRWRLRAKNHKIIADSAEGYQRITQCDKMIRLFKFEGVSAEVVDLTTPKK